MSFFVLRLSIKLRISQNHNQCIVAATENLHYFNFLKVLILQILYFQLLKNIVLPLIFVYAGSVQDRWDQSESEKNDYPETKSQIGTTTTV